MTSSATTTAAVAEPPASVVADIARLGLDRHGYLFGHKLANSLSPFLHDVVYRHLGLRWSQFRLESDDIGQFLKLAQHPDFYGASVTMPNKVAIMRHLDEVTEECRDVGACNTLFIRQDPSTGRRLLCGANTDVIGVRYSFEQNVEKPEKVYRGRPALVIGGGGAARSAVYALRKWLGVGTIYLVNRDIAEVEAVKKDCVGTGYGTDLLHVKTVEQANALEGPGAIVSCVPDFAPQSVEERLARDITDTFLNKKDKGAMLEMCYNPTPFTQLGALAKNKGWQVILGTEALIGQGLEQDKYWTGKTIKEMPLEELQLLIADKIAAKNVQANL